MTDQELCSMAVTMGALTFWAGSDPGKACQAVVLGSSAGACLTLICLVLLRLRERPSEGAVISIGKRLKDTAVPLALADVLKSGINTTENLMVPKRLARNALVENPLAAFGMVSGMVFPVLMFPACILFALAELLIPELARCAAAGSRGRITYLTRRSLRIAMLYGVVFSGVMFLLSDDLCLWLYGSLDAGQFLRLYALLIPMLYCDAITDAMTKGLGQQKVCVRYNIFTSALDVAFLYLLLPAYGMSGYYASFLLTHVINFGLSLGRLLKITIGNIPAHIPLMSAAAAAFSIWAASYVKIPLIRCSCYLLILGSLLFLFKIITFTDLRWLKSLIYKKTSPVR